MIPSNRMMKHAGDKPFILRAVHSQLCFQQSSGGKIDRYRQKAQFDPLLEFSNMTTEYFIYSSLHQLSSGASATHEHNKQREEAKKYEEDKGEERRGLQKEKAKMTQKIK